MDQSSNSKLGNSQFYLLAILVLAHLFGWSPGVNLSLFLLGISVFFRKDFGLHLKQLLTDRYFLISIIPFLIYALSLLYTADTTEGIRNVVTKLPLLVLPFIMGMLSINQKEDWWNVGKLYVWGVALMGIIGFVIQYTRYSKTGDSGLFYNDNLGSAFGKQAVYFAWYVNSAIALLLLKWKHIAGDRRKFFGLFLLTVLIGIQVLLASRTSLVLMISISCFYGYYQYKIRGFSVKKLALAASAMLAIVVLTTFLFPKGLNRFKSITQISYRLDNPNPLNHFNGTYSKDNWDGMSARLAIWECSWSAIQKYCWTGCGVGDVPAELRKVYKEKNFILGQKEDFNTHNQFLDSWLSAGIFGFLAFIMMFILLISKAIRKKHIVFVLLMSVFAISMLTENILNRNQGVIIAGLLVGINYRMIRNNVKENHVS